MVGGAIHRVRFELDVEIQIAGAPAIESPATLTGQAQPLAIDGTRGNTRLHLVRDAAHPSGGIVFGHGQLHFQRRAVEGILDADLGGDFEVLAGHRIAARSEAAVPRSLETREQVAESHVIEREAFVAAGMLASPVRRRAEFLALRSLAQRVISRAFFRILQCLVGLGDFLEADLGLRFLGNIRMVFVGEFPIGLLDLFGRSAALDPERGVVIAVFHFTGWGRAASASACSRQGPRTSTREWPPRARLSRVFPGLRARRFRNRGGAPDNHWSLSAHRTRWTSCRTAWGRISPFPRTPWRNSRTRSGSSPSPAAPNTAPRRSAHPARRCV